MTVGTGRGGTRPVARGLGLLMVTAGAAVMAWALAAHYHAAPRGWELTRPTEPPRQAPYRMKYLLRSGPYRLSRNPMYVGEAVVWLGWSVFYGSRLVWAGLAIICAALPHIVSWEERRLLQRFGSDYRAYLSAVPRWGGVRPGSIRECQVTEAQLSIADAEFWRQPLAARMAHFARLRELGPFTRIPFTDPVTEESGAFFTVTRYGEVVEISRRPEDFCSGRGSTSINDLPTDLMEYFGSFIVMDDPRHARQRGIVARAFTPRKLEELLASVERICAELIDGICERGGVDLVEAISEPFPLLVICDMMGIPRSEFATVLQATNVILGAGDADRLGGRDDVLGALLEAGVQLTSLMNELAEHRRANPADDLTSALVNNDLGEDMLAPHELAPFFILLAVAGNDTTRTAISLGMQLLHENPDQRALWQGDLGRMTPTAVEEIVRAASPVTFMRRTVTRDLTLSGHDFHEGDRIVLFYGAANRDPRVFADPERFDVLRDPNPHVGFGGPGPHFCLGAHLARRELSVVFRQLLTRLPDLEVAGEPEYLRSLGIPLVGGVKHLPIRYTPTAPLGAH